MNYADTDISDMVEGTDGTYTVQDTSDQAASEPEWVEGHTNIPTAVQADLFDDCDSRRTFHEKALVYKRNELVHGHIRMTAASQKVLATVISMINPLNTDGLPHFKFGVPEFAALCGVSVQYIYKTIKDITIELQGKVLTVPKIHFEYEETVRTEKKLAAKEGRDPIAIPRPTEAGNKRSFVNINLFDLSSYDDDTKQIEFILDERALVYVYALKQNFTGYHLRHIKRMRSQHSIRLYEIMRSYLSLKYVTQGHKVISRTIPYAELRDMLGLYPTEYKKWYDFDRRVLSVAKKELSDTDLDFTWYIPERKGVKGSRVPVKNVTFTIYARFFKKDAVDEGSPHTWRQAILLHVPEKALEKLIGEYNEDRVQRNAEEVLVRIADGKAIANVPAYLKTLVERDAVGSLGATNPFTYKEGPERNFVQEVLLPIWKELSQEVTDQFITHRLRQGKVADMYKEYIKETGQESKEDRKNRLRAKLRDIGDLDW